MGGRILVSKQYTAICATCDEGSYYEYHDSMAQAIKSFRLLGWRKTKLGWQCKGCLGKTNQEVKEQ